MTAMTKCPVAGGKIPVLDQDPFSPESLENPLPFQEALREAGPVAYLSKYGAYAIGRYEHMSQAVSNWQELTSGEGVGLLPPTRARGLLQMDPPEHDTPREVLQEILSARVPRSMKDNCMLRAEALFDELLDGVPSGGEVLVDGVQQVGAVFPVNFFPDASGIDPAGREKLVPYADHIFNSLGPRNELFEKGAGQAKELNEWATGKCQRDALAPKASARTSGPPPTAATSCTSMPRCSPDRCFQRAWTPRCTASPGDARAGHQPRAVRSAESQPGLGARGLRRVAARGLAGAADLPRGLHRRGDRGLHHPEGQPRAAVLPVRQP